MYMVTPIPRIATIVRALRRRMRDQTERRTAPARVLMIVVAPAGEYRTRVLPGLANAGVTEGARNTQGSRQR